MNAADQSLYAVMPEPHLSLLLGMILGNEAIKELPLYEDLRTVGLVHMVVLSGTNISFLSSAVALFTRPLGRVLSTVITICTLVLFIVMVGPDPPIVRAGIMGGITAIGFATGRKAITWYSLLLSSILILIFQPVWISSISFQLSYAATIGIILFGRPVEKIEKYTLLSTFCGYLKSNMRLTLAAQAFTTPLIALYFHQISLISPLSNILVSWTVAPIMIVGVVTLVIAHFSLSLSYIPAYFTYALLEIIISVTRLCAGFPWASFSW